MVARMFLYIFRENKYNFKLLKKIYSMIIFTRTIIKTNTAMGLVAKIILQPMKLWSMLADLNTYMGDEEPATLDGQFFEFAKMMDKKRDGTTITLYNSDFWMRQCKLLDDRKVTMTDTGIIFNKFSKSEINWEEWNEFLVDLCDLKELDLEKTQETLTNSGLPGQTPVLVPQYRDFFATYKPKEKMLF